MSILKWLHLSDFHFGKDRYDERALCKMISSQLKASMEEDIDAIFITGDIAYKGIHSQYDEFETFLLAIDEIYHNKKLPQIYIVPGNHDVNRDINSMVQTSLYNYKNENAFSKLLDPTLEGLELRNQIIPRFSEFLDTFKNSLCFSVENLFSEKGFFADSITTNGVTVGIAGINTAWLSCSDNDKEKITPGTRIVEEAINAISRYDYKILLGHHPLSWFQSKDYNIISSLLAKNNVIYLYGHLHKNEAGYQIGVSGKAFMHFGVGAAFLTREMDYLRHSIQYGELNEKGVKIHPLRWSEEQNEWILDSPEYFPNSNRISGKDYWFFPFPSSNPIVKVKRSSSLGQEWVLIDKLFVEAHESKKPSDEEMLMFFDGRSPEYSFVFSSKIPVRKKATEFVDEFLISEKNKRSKGMLITGAGGEGKTTLALQIIYKLAKQEWIILHCVDPNQTTTIELSDLEAYDRPILIVIDNASLIANKMFDFLNSAKKSGRIVHLLFISVLSDWLNSKALDLQWKVTTDYSSYTLSGVEEDEAKDIVKAWSQYGDAGLGALSECADLDTAAERLYQASKGASTDHILDGALLGAIIKTRYRDEYYKEHVRLIMKRLQKTRLGFPNTDETLLDVFLRIASMHKEEKFILSSDILAELYHCSESDIKRKVIRPLGKEAVTSKSGDIIYIRHTALANCAMKIAEEEFNYVTEDYFPEMASAAVKLRTDGKYVFKIEEWRYLADHFLNKGMKRLAVRIAETVYKVDVTNLQVFNHLLKIYLGEPDPAYEVVYDILSKQPNELFQHAFLRAFAISAKFTEKEELSAYLDIISLSDSSLDGKIPRQALLESIYATTDSLLNLAKLYGNEAFENAGMAFAHITVKLDKCDKYKQKLASETIRKLPSCACDSDSLEHKIANGVNALAELLSLSTLPNSIPKPENITFDKLLEKF